MDDIPLDNRAPRPAADTPFRMMVETAGDILFIAVPDGSVTYFNPRWYEFTGLTPEQSLGWRWMQRIHPDDRDKAMDGWRRALESGSPWVTRLPLIGRDGTDCCFLCRARPLGASGENWFGACADIDELVRAEEALRASKQALTEAAHRKDEFLAILAHELRNPLAPLSTGLEIMRRAGGDLVVIDKARTMMQGQVAQMVRLVDDLLDVSRITRGKLELRKARVELATIVANAVDTARPEIDAGHHRLHVDLPPQPVWLDADANRLAQVFANLLNNAARYTREPGDIRLTATVEAGEVAVTVSDTGIGIQRDKLNVIFDMFTQVEQQFEQTPAGVGIGLTLVKSFVEMHGGNVSAHSDGHNRGSAFRVRLPVASAPERPHPVSDADEARAAGRQRVLIVDDNRDAAEGLAMLLGLMGSETRIAHDGAEALDAGGGFRPTIVLMDLGMPRLDGYSAAREIRRRPWGRDVVLVALTGWGQESDKRRTREAGFNRHLIKPVQPEVLEKLLRDPRTGTA